MSNFYNELRKALSNDNLKIKTNLKTTKPNDKILNQLSKKFKVNFEIDGELKQTKNPITLKFDKNYKYLQGGNKQFNKFYKSKLFGVYKKLKNNKYEVYDGYNLKTVNDMVEYKTFKLTKIKRNEDLVEEFNKYSSNFKTLKELINYDITKCVFNTHHLALRIWYKITGKNITFEPMTNAEQLMIYYAKRCGFRYSNKSNKELKGDFVKLDVNSFYSSILINKKYTLPIGKPEFKTLTQQEFEKLKFYQYGLYYCKIIGDINPKLFYKNTNNIYTHLELKIAKEQNYKMELLFDKKFNFMYYPKRINNHILFEKYINYLYPHKKDCFLIKRLLNILWGALSSKNWITDGSLNLDDNLEFKVKYDNDFCIQKVDKITEEQIFKYNSAKIAPFITSYGRYELYKLIKNYHTKIHYIHTDGFVIDRHQMSNFDIGTDMGQLKIEEELTKI